MDFNASGSLYYLHTKQIKYALIVPSQFACRRILNNERSTFLLRIRCYESNKEWCDFTNQLAEFHHEEEGDTFAALAQTLKDVGMFKTSAGGKTKQTVKQVKN